MVDLHSKSNFQSIFPITESVVIASIIFCIKRQYFNFINKIFEWYHFPLVDNNLTWPLLSDFFFFLLARLNFVWKENKNMEKYDEDEVHTITYDYIMAPNRCTKRFLKISDTIIALVIVTPLVVGYWYGTWDFMDNHAEYFPPIPTLLFGMCYHLLIVLFRHKVHEKVKIPHQEKTLLHSIARYIFTKLFIYVFSIACLMIFRAIFVLCAPYGKQDMKKNGFFFLSHEYLNFRTKNCLYENQHFLSVHFIDLGFVPASIMLIICGMALVCLKSVRNIIAPPVVIVTDCKEISFAFPTRFKSEVSIRFLFLF